MALLPDVLGAGGLELRRWSPDQLDAALDAITASLPELRRWMPWAQVAPEADGLRAVLQEGRASFDADREWQYMLYERHSGELVGAAGLHAHDGPTRAEIGYWVRSDRTSRGYATAAAGALATAAFTYVGWVEQIVIRMDVANLASAAIPPALGFRLMGEEERDIVASGHTGRGYVWVLDRPGR
jgi:RimJ/RimL family protein N-acetyltransferase